MTFISMMQSCIESFKWAIFFFQAYYKTLPGPIGLAFKLAWPQFWPQSWPLKKFGLALKVVLASNLAYKECLASNFIFSSNFRCMPLFFQLLIHLDTLLTNTCIKVYRSTKHIVLELISFHKTFYLFIL